MKVYVLRQRLVTGYDTYDSAVVIAEDEESARETSPSTWHTKESPYWAEDWVTWENRHQVDVEYLGETEITTPQLVLASFNAG